MTYRVIDQAPGPFVKWERTYPRRADQRPHRERLSVEVHPVHHGTRLTPSASGEVERLRLVSNRFDAAGRRELRVPAQALAQVC